MKHPHAYTDDEQRFLEGLRRATCAGDTSMVRSLYAAALERAEKAESGITAEGDRITDAFMDQLAPFFKRNGGDGYLGGEGTESSDPADWMADMAMHVAGHFVDERDALRAERDKAISERDELREAINSEMRKTIKAHAELAVVRAALHSVHASLHIIREMEGWTDEDWELLKLAEPELISRLRQALARTPSAP